MPLLHGTKPIEYLVAAIMAAVMAVGGVLIIAGWSDRAGFGIALLAGGGMLAVWFGIEARRRYARRRKVRAALSAPQSAVVPGTQHLPDGDRVTFNDAEGKPVRRGVMQDGKVVFLD